MEGIYNLRSPAVKRLMREAEELKSSTEEYYAQPLNDNLFEWHFTVRGPPNTEFDGGVYHGRITLPADYPMKPPSIILLTPNGRFEVNKKICLSISGHHPESWQPSWSIRTALLAIIGFMPTHGNGALGSLDYSPEERIVLAHKSRSWACSECGPIKNLLQDNSSSDSNVSKQVKGSNAGISNKDENNANASAVSSDAEANPKVTNMNTDTVHPQPHDVQTIASGVENMPRQRQLASSGMPATTAIQPVSQNLPIFQHVFITACIWMIVCILLILLIRRLFFL